MESNPNKQHKVNEVAEKIIQSQNNLKPFKLTDGKQKSYNIVESKSETKVIDKNQYKEELDNKNDEINFYERILGGKDYLQYYLEQMKMKKQPRRGRG